MNSKLENIEAICFIMIFCINGIILSTSKYLVDLCSSSSLINVIIISVLCILIILLFCFLLNRFGDKGFLGICEFLGGNFLKFIIGSIFIIYFLFRSVIFLKKISNCLQIIYFPMTNIIFIIAMFCIAILLISNLKNNAIIKSNVLIVPILFVTIILVFLGNFKNYNFENIFPVFGNGISATFFSGLSNIFAFSGISYILFFPPILKHPEKLTKISLISMILSAIFLFISIANILFLFGTILGGAELFPLYISVRYIEFGTFFQRLDSVFLFICIIGAISFLCINTYITLEIFKSIFNLSDSTPIVYPYILVLFSASLLIRKDSTLQLLENNVYRISFISISIVLPLILLVLANIKKLFLSFIKLNIERIEQ